MDNKRNNVAITKKRILSLICLIVFSLAFIFACLKNVLPIGKWIVCTFGIMTYPLFLVLSLVELAKFLGLKYSRNKKSTVFALILIASLLCVIQSISTYKQLDKVATFASLKTYLDYSYTSKITFIGSFGSIFVGGLSTLLGAMGTIVAFVIILTISIGILVDYENYGKYDENINKLGKKSLKKKVEASDKDALANGEPNYGYKKDDNIAGTIEVDPSEINYSNTTNNYQTTTSYSNDDVVGEVTDNSSYETQDDQYNYSNPFSFGNDSDEDKNESRKSFVDSTFGRYDNDESKTTEEDTSSPITDYNYGLSNKPVKNSTNLWGNDEKDDNKIDLDDNLKQILSKKEDDVDELYDSKNSGFGNDVTSTPYNPANLGAFGNDTTFGQNENGFGNNGSNGFGLDIFGGNNDTTSDNSALNNFGESGKVENHGFEDTAFGYSPKTFETNAGLNDGQNLTNSNPFGSDEDDISKRNAGILASTQKPRINNGLSVSPLGMPGVRYNPPPLSLLAKPKADTGDYSEEQARKSKQLEDVLESFGVPAKVVKIVRGPKITRYELSVPLGISVKRILNYELDIQSSLAAKTITIQAPIPGSKFVGIELENDTFTSVSERELLESPEFQNAKDPLPIAVGKDISGQIIVKSLTKMVHVLIAGSTGSGKSVFIHNIVLSLIYKYSPDDLRLIMVDPKRVEFGFYNGLPHLVTPEVVLGTEKAVSALKWCVKEMDRRFEIMSRANYKNISDYNKSELVKSGEFEHFPYIVIIVDELAEIMTLYKKEAEGAIQRITQLARACGMHLVVAVQRPSVDIITGVIKNNISSRFAFRLQSGFDSKTMLGTNGAEKLLGQGDMLMALTDSSAMPRLQAAYASDDEIKAVVEYVTKNNPANFDKEAEQTINADPQDVGGTGGAPAFINESKAKVVLDENFKIAVKTVMMNGSASISYLQRRLGIGYSRAAKIVDQMEDKGFVAPNTGAKTRKVLITPEQYKEEFGEDFNS